MPLIVTDPSILKAARAAIEVLLRFKGQQITLIPTKGTKIPKPGGGHDFADPIPRAPQTFALSKINNFDAIEYSPNDDGKNQKRSYLLTGRHDAVIAKGDNFSDTEADYVVDTLDQTSGFKTMAGVTGWLKQV